MDKGVAPVVKGLEGEIKSALQMRRWLKNPAGQERLSNRVPFCSIFTVLHFGISSKKKSAFFSKRIIGVIR
jgi:hypothetical protein